jgi:hypothetical protein
MGLQASMAAAGSFIVSGRCSMVTSESFRINIDILHVSRRRRIDRGQGGGPRVGRHPQASGSPAMRAIFYLVAAASALLLASPANAWWSYAQWGLNESQLMSASSGQAGPCRQDAPVCATTPNGNQPRLFIASIQMLGMPASVSFSFDAAGKLTETVVRFSNADFALISDLLQGIHGQAVEDRPGTPPVRIWRDQRRGSTISATPIGAGTQMDYRPANRPG